MSNMKQGGLPDEVSLTSYPNRVHRQGTSDYDPTEASEIVLIWDVAAGVGTYTNVYWNTDVCWNTESGLDTHAILIEVGTPETVHIDESTKRKPVVVT